MSDNLQPWKTIARREALDQRPWLRVWLEDVVLPDGRIISDFSTLEMPDYVVIVAVTTDGLIVTERNYKHGPRKIGLHLPAGYLESGEEPLLAAQRELREETGYAAQDWQPLGSFVIDGNRGGGTGHFFLAREAQIVALPDSGDLEEIAVMLFPIDRLIEATRTGEINIVSIAAAIGLAVTALGISQAQ